MNHLYAVAVENADTGAREGHLWNVTATSPEEALANSDASLRALGWPPAWRSTAATFIYASPPVYNPGPDAIVETIRPGTPEWDTSERELETQRRHGG